MGTAFASGRSTVIEQLAEALGLKGRCWSKFVLEVGLNDVVRLYVSELPSEEKLGALTSAITGVEVIPVDSVGVTDKAQVVYARAAPP